MAVLLFSGLVLQAASALCFFFREGVLSRARQRACLLTFLLGTLPICVFAAHDSDYTLLGGQLLLACAAAGLARRTATSREE